MPTLTGACGADTLANDLLTELTVGVDFTLPDIDLSSIDYAIPSLEVGEAARRLTNADLTEKTVDGAGTFDVVMSSMAAHLRREFEQNRITGEQYTKAFIALAESSMSNSVQFLLGQDQAYWQSITARLQAQVAQIAVIKAKIDLDIAKAQVKIIRFQANTAQAEYALTKMKLSSESVQFCSAKYTLDNILPEQKALVMEQVETARGATSNMRRDGAPIAGSIGKQVELQDQQITSYKRDAEVKAAKIFSDAWITMKTIDEGLLPPTGFTNVSLDQVLTTLKTNIGIV